MSTILVNNIKDTGNNTLLTSDGSGNISSGGLMTNTPSFFAYRTSGQTLSNDTETKIQMNVELYDTNSAYDNSTNYRFTVPSGFAGKYAIGGYCRTTNFSASRKILSIFKNGSNIMQGEMGNDSNYQTLQASTVADLAVGDYIELYGYQNSGSSQTFASGALYQTGFFGYRIIGA